MYEYQRFSVRSIVACLAFVRSIVRILLDHITKDIVIEDEKLHETLSAMHPR